MRRIALLIIAAFIIVPLGIVGCKGKVENAQEEPKVESVENQAVTASQNVMSQAQSAEPAQNVAAETIPPSATPPIAQKAASVTQEKSSKGKDIQKALKNAGFYTGTVDGKIGPRTKKAIEDFQKAKGLKADGKVGPKTWVELEKYLSQ